MKIRAKLNYLRISPRKVRLVADLIRGKSFAEAESMLLAAPKKSALPLLKLLRSAFSNARHNFQIADPKSFRVSAINVDAGPIIKRSRPRAFGRAFPIRKRTSHLSIILETAAALAPKGRKAKKPGWRIGKEAESRVEEALEKKPMAEREILRARPKVSTKSTDFVRRMFRRKAI